VRRATEFHDDASRQVKCAFMGEDARAVEGVNREEREEFNAEEE
jgi:hypothetical protein